MQQTTLKTLRAKQAKISVIECLITGFILLENIVAKGEIARFKQFLRLPQNFQKSSAAESVLYEGMHLRSRNRLTRLIFQ